MTVEAKRVQCPNCDVQFDLRFVTWHQRMGQIELTDSNSTQVGCGA